MHRRRTVDEITTFIGLDAAHQIILQEWIDAITDA